MNKIVFAFFLFIPSYLAAQNNDPEWDNTAKNKWNPAFEEVSIPSTADGSIQKAFLYRSGSKTPKPLIVSLHTWSGNYTQKDPITKEILARDWNYIHPDFRGANNRPEAMISPLVLADIEDAIRYAVEHTNTDPSEVHVIGVSGGGLATLAAYMNVKYPVKSFSAWAPISDIDAWYWESVGRKQKYANDMLKGVGTKDGIFDREEALKRSPLVHTYPKEERQDAKLYIYEGVHDGYKGSVPITHAINMYNRLVGDLKYNTANLKEIMPYAVSDPDLVTEAEIIDLVTKRYNPDYNKEADLFGREIYLFREYENIQLTIFEGGHEQIPQALALIPYEPKNALAYNILTIGDSNAHNEGGWVEQLKKMLPVSTIINISRGGRSIGFDNNGKEDLNVLKKIDDFLNMAQEQLQGKKYDYLVICLGTNDVKTIFSDRQAEVVPNFERLLDKIKAHRLVKRSKPGLIFVTPPPVGTKEVNPKYENGNERLKSLVPELMETASRKGFEVIDMYHLLAGILDYYAPDGVHMVAAGQEIIASKIVEVMQKGK